MRLVFDIPDRPGVLGEISARIGAARANIIEVSHHRLFTSPSVQAARLEVMFEGRDSAHSAKVFRTCRGTMLWSRCDGDKRLGWWGAKTEGSVRARGVISPARSV